MTLTWFYSQLAQLQAVRIWEVQRLPRYTWVAWKTKIFVCLMIISVDTEIIPRQFFSHKCTFKSSRDEWCLARCYIYPQSISVLSTPELISQGCHRKNQIADKCTLPFYPLHWFCYSLYSLTLLDFFQITSPPPLDNFFWTPKTLI